MATDVVAQVNKLLGRKSPGGVTKAQPIRGTDLRLTGSVENGPPLIGRHPDDQWQEGLPPTGRSNLYPTPYHPEIPIATDHSDNGNRNQELTAYGLHLGPQPGRIVRFFTPLNGGKLGREITGGREGTVGFELDPTGGRPNGGYALADAKYIQHEQIPRGAGNSKVYNKTFTDAMNIPAIFVADPSQR